MRPWEDVKVTCSLTLLGWNSLALGSQNKLVVIRSSMAQLTVGHVLLLYPMAVILKPKVFCTQIELIQFAVRHQP
jgi:hypothetical protein